MSFDIDEDLQNNGDENEPGMTQDVSTNKGTCRSCKAEILWIKVNGKNIPVNAKPEYRYIGPDILNGAWIFKKTYTPHFSTCPDAAKFRNGGKTK